MATYNQTFTDHTVTIANGGTASTAIDLLGKALVQIILPSAFTGSAITFQTSRDNSTFVALYNTANTQMSMTVTQNRAYAINPADLAGARYLKLVSGSAEGADRTITLITRELS